MKRLISTTLQTDIFGIDTTQEINLIYQKHNELKPARCTSDGKKHGAFGSLYCCGFRGHVNVFVVESFMYKDIEEGETTTNAVAYVATRIKKDGTINTKEQQQVVVEKNNDMNVIRSKANLTNVNEITLPDSRSLRKIDARTIKEALKEIQDIHFTDVNVEKVFAQKRS